MTIWFTSDTHFGHGGALGLFRRPFASTAEMDRELVRRWNERVAADDEVWHLGDVAVRPAIGRVAPLVSELSGVKHLLLGNNDGEAVAGLDGWASVGHYAELELGETRLVLGHYPFRSWNGMHRGALNLHGHSHGKLTPLPRQCDVGVDAWDFRPITLDEISQRLSLGKGARRPAGTATPPSGRSG